MATDIIARGMITEYKSGTNISFTENDDGSVTISASGDVSSEDTVARETIDNHKLDKNNPHNVTAEQVGLGNVDNTADLDKPISTAVQAELEKKADKSHTHSVGEVTDFPNSLPANGGNADTVDGFDVAEYITTLPEGEYYTEVARINTRNKTIESCDTSNLKVGLADYATNADYAMNANTVNNHTVDSDVPANAVFTDTTDSDVMASGNPVQLEGLQGGVPFSEMVVSGKNLIPYPYYHGTSRTEKGITFTVNDDGTITANGTSTGTAIFRVSNFMPINRGKFTISGCPNGGSNNTFKIGVYTSGTTELNIANDYGSGSTFAIEDTQKIGVWCVIYAGQALDNLVFRPQLELGSTATEYEPPITGRGLTVNVCGKNLLKYPYSSTDLAANGISFTDNKDGTISVNGTATDTVYFNIANGYTISLKGGVRYTVSLALIGDYEGYCDLVMQYVNDDGTAGFLGVNNTDKKTFTFTPARDTDFRVWFRINKDVTVNCIVYPQLELGDTATEYEPYHGAEYTITPTSNPYVIPNDIRQVEGLNVVSVSEGEISVTGVRKNAALKKIWDDMGMDLLFDGTVTTGTNCITDNVNGYNFLYFYGNLSSVSGASGNVTGSLVVPKTARAISAGQSLVVTTGVTYITVNIINIESGVITFTVTPNDSSREIYEFKVFGIK